MAISRKKIGFLGGGQLAQMMVLKAHQLGLEPHVLCPNPESPAAQATRYWHRGDSLQIDDVRRFLQTVQTVTFESEFVDPDVVHQAAQEVSVKIHPNLSALKKVRDRLTQKKLLSTHSLPSSNFLAVSDRASLEFAANELKLPLVLKKRLFGYDGYGTYILKSPEEVSKFATGPLTEPGPGFIAETFIPFQRELAISLARNGHGETIVFPLVQTHQENSRCLWVTGPAQSPSLHTLLERCKNLMEAEDYIGIMAIELFETEKGSLMVNELAPRVHNSAHHSQDSMNVCQFETHLRCILGWPLIPPKLIAPGFAMYNLLGQDPPLRKPIIADRVHLHWYNKSQSRPGRKMGHINTMDETAEKALERLMGLAKGRK